MLNISFLIYAGLEAVAVKMLIARSDHLLRNIKVPRLFFRIFSF